MAGTAVPIASLYLQFAPRENIPHTAFQILKALEFSKAFSGYEECDSWLVGEIISRWGRGMLRWLERYDRRESLSWYHKEDEGFKVFRLDDHVWIWRALRAMEDDRHGAWEGLQDSARHGDRGSPAGPEESDAEEMSRLRRKFSSRIVQREVLRKFTTEHEILRKRMVALSRSPRETRFLLHARDTALLYGQDMGFFAGDSSSQEAWKNTLDAQRFHENNQEAWWDNALQYALSIMLGIRGHQINNKKPGHMVRTATEVLLRSISENGLFSGKLDMMTKGPSEDFFHAEVDNNSHHEAGFEIPYIVLTHAKEIGAIVDAAAEPALENASGEVKLRHHPAVRNPQSIEAIPTHDTSSPQAPLNPREEGRELWKMLEELSDVLSARPYIPNSTSGPHPMGSRGLVADAPLALKKSVPFSNNIDSHSIVEIEDEWLFNYPEFFGSEKDDNASIDEALDSLKDVEVTWPTSIDFAEMRRKYSSSKGYHRVDDQAIASGSFHNENYGADEQSLVSYSSRNSESCTEEDQSTAHTYYSSSVSTVSSISLGGPGDSGLRVFDMPSRKHLRVKGARATEEIHLGSLEDIWEHISGPRTAARAKKRLVVWDSRRGADPGHEAALLCYAASKGAERATLLEFFERHFRHENFVFDHCSLTHNTWETELHLRFFILAGGAPSGGAANPNAEGFPRVRGRHICRGSTGVRFSGDAFDRYWTFHMFSIEDLAGPDRKDAFSRFIPSNAGQFFQRKVLELHIFAGMLDLVESSTEQILAEVKSEMGIKSGAFSWSVPSMDTYSYWRRVWEDFAPLLQALASDLASALDVIAQWEAHEAGRGQERPRWTRNDEKKYRAAIVRGRRVLRLRGKKARDLLGEVESLREACAARLANARDELSFRRSQDIASFTYVTIVFLPLGFAASVFSMNGYPAAAWVGSMAAIAIFTLAATAIALANTRMLLGVAEKLSKDALRVTNAVLDASLLGQQQKRRRNRQNEQTGREPPHSHGTRHILFWMAYLLIELPARRVALACRALPSSLMQSKDLPGPNTSGPSSSSSSFSFIFSPSANAVGSAGGPPEQSAMAIDRKLIRVTGGILILPLLLVSWTIQILFYNVLDVLTLLGRLALKTLCALVAPSDTQGPATDSKMVTWLIEPPLSLRPVRKFMSRDKESKK